MALTLEDLKDLFDDSLFKYVSNVLYTPDCWVGFIGKEHFEFSFLFPEESPEVGVLVLWKGEYRCKLLFPRDEPDKLINFFENVQRRGNFQRFYADEMNELSPIRRN